MTAETWLFNFNLKGAKLGNPAMNNEYVACVMMFQFSSFDAYLIKNSTHIQMTQYQLANSMQLSL